MQCACCKARQVGSGCKLHDVVFAIVVAAKVVTTKVATDKAVTAK